MKSSDSNPFADIGLLYYNNEYDKARYLKLQEISIQLLSKVSGQNIVALKEIFPLHKDYPTPKVDIRILLLVGLCYKANPHKINNCKKCISVPET